jgi:2'-5' RNA ligase
MRVFLAIDLPEEVKEKIVALQQKLKFFLQGVRWVRPEGLHLTLKFFGDIGADQIPGISNVVEERAAKAAPVTLTADALGAFPNLERPRVLWLGMTGDVDAIVTLQRAIEAGLEPLGYRREKRKFHPHLTVGRAKSSKGMILGLSEDFTEEHRYPMGEFTAQGLTLFRSELKRGGAVYTDLAYFPFGTTVNGK